VKTQGALHGVLKPAFDRYKALEGDEPKDLFRKDMGSFLRLYEFLSQIISYDDPELEKLFHFAKNLMPRLAADSKDRNKLELDSDVLLTHYRLQKWAGDPSAKGLKQSYGLMVNYLYDLRRLDKHRALLSQGKIPVASGIEDLYI
jgi:hypothetical protein